MLTKKNYLILLKLFLFAGIVYFPIFLHLEYLPIRIWDEARLAINAYEMHENGNFIVTYFKGNPDMWNTKPPLMIWFQVIFIKLFGVGELAIRLPAAIAAFLTCVLLMVFFIKYLESYWFGLIAVIVLITSQGYISVHGTRTGDYDSLLVFFLTLSSLSLFCYLQDTSKARYLYLLFISLILGVLTKGIAGLMVTPALFLFVVIKRKLVFLIKNKHLYNNIGIFILVVLGYYILREVYNPGYIKAVFENEMGGRYLDTIENHKHEFWFYYNNFIHERFKPWVWLLPVGIVIGLIQKNEKIRNLTIFSIVIVFQYFFTISYGQTKLEWYDLPLYPFLSILTVMSIYLIFRKLIQGSLIKNMILLKVVSFLFLIAVFCYPYKNIIEKVFKPKEYPWHEEFYKVSYYLRDALRNDMNFNNYSLLYNGYNAHLYFYIKQFQDKDQNVKIITKDDLTQGELVIADQVEMKDYIEANFSYEITETYKNVNVYKLGKTDE